MAQRTPPIDLAGDEKRYGDERGCYARLMAQPPPPGYGPGYAYDPYAADRALAEWAAGRGFTLGASPDFNWYLAWYPMTYAPRFARLGRELRGAIEDAALYAVETFDPDPFKQAAGEDRAVLFFLTSPRIAYRASLRAKTGGGVLTELSSGLGSLLSGGAAPGGVLGDPTLEARFDVSSPTRDEGNAALPMPLRQLVVTTGFRGVIETRAGGMVVTLFDLRGFDAAGLERALPYVGQIYGAAVSGR